MQANNAEPVEGTQEYRLLWEAAIPMAALLFMGPPDRDEGWFEAYETIVKGEGGYRFDHWATDGADYRFAFRIDKDISYEVYFRGVPNGPVLYDSYTIEHKEV